MRRAKFLRFAAIAAAAGATAAISAAAVAAGGCPIGSPTCAPQPGLGSTPTPTVPQAPAVPVPTTPVAAKPAPGPVGPRPTMTLSARSLEFGGTLVISGTVRGARPGQQVDLLTKSCGFVDTLPIAKTKTRARGAFSFSLQPMRNAAYIVRAKGAASAPLQVKVRPKIELKRTSTGSFSVDVALGAGVFLTGPVTLERYDAARKHWSTLAAGTLKQSSDPTAIVAVSSTTIQAQAPVGAKLRVSAPQPTVGACYVAGKSPAITG